VADKLDVDLNHFDTEAPLQAYQKKAVVNGVERSGEIQETECTVPDLPPAAGR